MFVVLLFLCCIPTFLFNYQFDFNLAASKQHIRMRNKNKRINYVGYRMERYHYYLHVYETKYLCKKKKKNGRNKMLHYFTHLSRCFGTGD
jgi:hypothetical protein